MLKRLLTSLALLYTLNGPALSQVSNASELDNSNKCSTEQVRLEQIIEEDKPVSKTCSEIEIIPQQLYLVSQIIGQDEVADQTPKYAKVGQEVRLYVVLEAKVDKDTIYYTTAPKIELTSKKIFPEQVKTWPANNPQPEIEIFKVEFDNKWYKYPNNNKPVKYLENKIDENKWNINADVHPNTNEDQFPDLPSGLGVMRYKATAKYKDKVLMTPGKESIQYGGISDKVIRVSFRPDTGSWIDHLFEMFNNPYIWGSNGNQIDRQIGSDCADLVLYGWRRAGHEKLEYTWSTGLQSKPYTKIIVEINPNTNVMEFNSKGEVVKERSNLILDKKGNEISFNTIKEGDVVFFERHVGALYQDNGNGVLDCNDLIIHTLFASPKIQGICDAFGIPIKIGRWIE